MGGNTKGMAEDHRTADHTRPTNATRDSEVRAARANHEAGRGPSSEEEKAAEGLRPEESVREHYQEMTERGANQKGEGRPSS
jgi:hypothetical protein